MTDPQGSTSITREEWQELGFTVGVDGELYVATVVAVKAPSAALEFKHVSRPIYEDWCLCCGSVDGSPCMCDSEDCATCDDDACECCSDPQQVR